MDFIQKYNNNVNNELYVLVNDPMENHNLVELEPDLASQLHHELDQWLGSFEDANVESSEPGDKSENQAVLQRLRDLGYVE